MVLFYQTLFKGRYILNSKRIIFVLLIIILSGVFVLPAAAVDKGDEAPSFVLTDMDRNYVFSKKLYGTGWVLLDFYATWCENCNAELPFVEEIYADFKDKGFTALLIATDNEGLDVLRPFFAERPTPLTVLVDKYQKAVEAFGVEALPTMFLVDPDGKIVLKTVGFHEEDIETIRKILSEGLDG